MQKVNVRYILPVMNPDGYLYSQVWITNIHTVELSCFGMAASFCHLVPRLPTECGEGLESQTTGAGAWGRTQTGTGVSTGTPPTDQAPTPAPGTSWAPTHSQR